MLTRFHAVRPTLRSDRRGVAGIDYALLAALVAAVIVSSGWPLAATEARMFADLGAALDGPARLSAARDWRAEARHHGQGAAGAVAGAGLAIGVSSPGGTW